MSDTRAFSRRSALAGFGIGSLGLFASHITNATALDAVSYSSTRILDEHPLTGLWLSHIALSAEGDQTAAAPAFFGADGTAVLVYPCAAASENGTQIRGLALGTWAPIDDTQARFTAVQVCFGADGSYQGTRTYDGYPVVSDDGASFTVKDEFDLVTVRDAGNAIIQSLSGGGRHMTGTRMTPGNVGFTPYQRSGSPEGAADDEGTGPLNVPEVAPVHPADPRLVDPK